MNEPRLKRSKTRPKPGHETLGQPRIYEGVIPLGLRPLHPPRDWEERVLRVQDAYKQFLPQLEAKARKELPDEFPQAKRLVKALADGRVHDERERLPRLRQELESLEGAILRFEQFVSAMSPPAWTVAQRFCRDPDDLLYAGKSKFVEKLDRLRRKLAERLKSMEDPPPELRSSMSKGAHARTWLGEPLKLLNDFWDEHCGGPIPTSLKTASDKIGKAKVKAFVAEGPEFAARLLIAAYPEITREQIATALRARGVKSSRVQE